MGITGMHSYSHAYINWAGLACLLITRGTYEYCVRAYVYVYGGAQQQQPVHAAYKNQTQTHESPPNKQT